MRQVGKLLSHHDGKMVTQQANDEKKPRPEKVTVLPARSPVGVIGLPMFNNDPTALSGYDSCIASGQSRRSDGVRA
jgi:hypothetical protein